MQRQSPYTKPPRVSVLVTKVIKLMGERLEEWQEFPDWCCNTLNATYKVIYKKIHNKFRSHVDFVNEEIERRRQEVSL